MPSLLNFARETTAGTGTVGTVTLTGAVSGYQTWLSAGAIDATTYRYGIEDGANFESGVGVFGTAGTTLTRGTILDSSAGSGTAISLSGTANVYATLLKQDLTLYESYVCIQDQKAQNTTGGTFTAGGWRTRDLTTEVSDTGSLASISSNQITLEAGTYRCLIMCPAFGVNEHQARLHNTSDSTVVLTGSLGYARQPLTYGMSTSFISGRFTLAAQKVLEVQHYCISTEATDGFGVKMNVTTEVYTMAEFWKEA